MTAKVAVDARKRGQRKGVLAAERIRGACGDRDSGAVELVSSCGKVGRGRTGSRVLGRVQEQRETIRVQLACDEACPWSPARILELGLSPSP